MQLESKNITEYCGISGVGKSTLLRADFYYKQKKGKDCAWPRKSLYEDKSWFYRNILKAFGVVKQIILHPKWFRKVLKILSNYKLSNKDFFQLLFNYLSLKNTMEKCNSKKYEYLFDEGVIQIIWATYMRSNIQFSNENCKCIFDLFSPPKKIIFVDAPTEIIVERLKERGRNTRILQFQDLKSEIDYMRIILNRILECAIKIQYIDANSIIKITNTKEIDGEKYD
ncbi:MAG: hypothetical protein LUG60_14845 [Erysipelotrichaceae bacterium]|nr:hypothetical protein [Erysipelotrichaceae bacterium]